MILINGWYFNFSKMMAYRGLNELTLHVRANGSIGRQYKHQLRNFFDPPEDHHNDIIDRAYMDFIFEHQILNSETNIKHEK